MINTLEEKKGDCKGKDYKILRLCLSARDQNALFIMSEARFEGARFVPQMEPYQNAPLIVAAQTVNIYMVFICLLTCVVFTSVNPLDENENL